MEGKILDYSGKSVNLPQLLSWRILRTDGDGCDAFCVRFVLDEKTDGWLSKAVEFSAWEKGKRVFRGVVDDYELQWNENGKICQLSGRGMAARLMDNEMPAAVYQTAYWQTIFSRYVQPFGVKAQAVSLPALQQFSVPMGASCWAVVKGFCENAGGKIPWCDANGVLQIAKEYATSKVVFSEQQLLSASYCNCRYGVISKQIQVTAEGEVLSAINKSFLEIGGMAQKVGQKTGKTLSCHYRKPMAQIEASRRDQNRLQLTFAGNFTAEPNTWVKVQLPSMGILQTFRVCSCLSEGSENGLTCTLELSVR